ncbi:O-antigen ligase family protein [Mycobacterium sp. C31M]
MATVATRTRITAPADSDRLTAGWIVLAGAVAASLLVAEYMGPLLGIAFALASCGFTLVVAIPSAVIRFPAAGYWLVGVLALGAATAVLANYAGSTPLDIDVQRDVGIGLSYLLFLAIGYTFGRTAGAFRLLLGALVAAGLAISIVHLVRLATVISSGVTDLYLFRLEAGRGSVTQLVALCACLLLLSGDLTRPWRRMVMGSAALLVISMLLTLSRGLMISLIIVVLGTLGLAIDRFGRVAVQPVRLVLTVLTTAAAVLGVYYFTVAFLPGVQAFLDEFFVTRVENSITEVSTTDLQTRTQIANNYRAFEVEQTIRQFGEQPWPAQVAGQGWGSVVKFGLETASTKVTFTRTEAAFLHNGYAYFLMKAGVLGALMYIAFLVHLTVRALKPTGWSGGRFVSMQRRVLLALVVALAVGTVTTGGFGYPATYLGLAVLLGACCAFPDRETTDG